MAHEAPAPPPSKVYYWPSQGGSFFLRRLLDTVLKVTSRPIFVSRCILFVLSVFPRGVLDEIFNLIESVSEDFPSYSCILELLCLCYVEILKKSPRNSVNALIIPILRDCLPNYFLVFLSFDVYLILC